MSKRAQSSFSSDSGGYDSSSSFSESDDFADVLDEDSGDSIRPRKRKFRGGDDHPDRDPDDEGEESDGPDDVDTDGEYDGVSHEELADTDDEDENDEDEDEDVGDEGDGEDDGTTYSIKSKKCHLSGLDSNSIVIDDDSNIYEKLVPTKIPNEKRTTGPEMTIYELVRIIGTRARQFSKGAPPLISGVNGLTMAQKAYVELITKQTPIIIERRLPGKGYEHWKIEEMNIMHKVTDEFFLPPGFDLETFKAKYLK